MAFGRALGETMAYDVNWNSPIFPKLLGRGQTLPSLTALKGSIRVRQSPSVRTLCCKCCVTGHFAGRIGNRLSFEEEVRKT